MTRPRRDRVTGEIRPGSHEVDILVDGDAVSWGLAEDSGRERTSDQEFQAAIEAVSSAAASRACGIWGGHPHCRRIVRGAVSSLTGHLHLAALAAATNNTWQVRRGLDGADHALLGELDVLAASVDLAGQGARRNRLPVLVVLVGQDHIYTDGLARLAALGIPTWVINPGRHIAASLYRAATEVTSLRAIA